MRNPGAYAFILVFCWSLTGGSTTEVAQKRVLKLKEYLLRAETYDPGYQNIIADRDQLAFLVDEGLPSRKVDFGVQAEFGSQQTSVITGTVSKEIIETGTEVSATHTRTSRPDRNEDITEVRVEQAILRNLLGRDVRLKKDALRDEEEAIRLEVLESYEVYLQDILSQYLDLGKAHLDVQVSQRALEDAERLKENVKERYRKKIATQSDVDRSELQALQRREDWISARKQLKIDREKVSRIIGDDSEFFPSETVFSLLQKEYVMRRSRPRDLSTLRTAKIASLRKFKMEKYLALAQRETLPSVGLIAGFDMDNSQRFNSTINRQEGIIGVNLTFSIWDTVTDANQKSAVLDLKKAELTDRLAQRDLRGDLQQLEFEIQELEQKRTLTQRKVKLAERIYRDENRRYGYGKIDLSDLIDLEKNLMQYRFQKQTDDLELGKAILKWLSMNDDLILLKDRLSSS